MSLRILFSRARTYTLGKNRCTHLTHPSSHHSQKGISSKQNEWPCCARQFHQVTGVVYLAFRHVTDLVGRETRGRGRTEREKTSGPVFFFQVENYYCTVVVFYEASSPPKFTNRLDRQMDALAAGLERGTRVNLVGLHR